MRIARISVACVLLASIVFVTGAQGAVVRAVSSAAIPTESGYTALTKSSSDGVCSTSMEIPSTREYSIANVQVYSDGAFCVVVGQNLYGSGLPDIWVKPTGVTSIQYLVVAGGGSGEASTSSTYAGGGGAAGQVLPASNTNATVSVASHSKLKLFSGRGSLAPQVRDSTSTFRYLTQTHSSGAQFSCLTLVSVASCLDPAVNSNVLIRAVGGSNGNVGGSGYFGSGGGPGRTTVGSPAKTPSLGLSGGAGNTSGAGGGAGACGSGGNATSSGGGSGGAGCASTITGTLAYYGVGGGGAALCAGCVGGEAPNGGGIGGTVVTKVGSSPSATNYGGGGGGSINSTSTNTAPGGNGVVIIRYANVSPPTWIDENISFGQCDRINTPTDWVSAAGVPTPQVQVLSGAVLPPGLTAKSDGSGFSGTVSGSGRYDFTVQASNSAGTISKRFVGSIEACVDVGIDSVSGPGTISPGGTGEITFVLANRAGPDTAPDATFTFRVPDNVVAAPRGFTCTGTTTLICSVGSIPRSSTASTLDRSLVFTVTVASSFSGNSTANGTCSVTTTALDSNSSNNASTCNFAVSAPSADLRVSSQPDLDEKTTFAPGEFGYRSFSIENVGPSDASNPTFAFEVDPSNIFPVSHVTGIGVWFTPSGAGAGTWSCSGVSTQGSKKILSCSSSTPMQKGASLVIKVKMQADISSSNGSTVDSRAIVQTTTSDPDLSNNEIAAMLMVVDLRPDLNISARFTSTNVIPGERTTLRIRVTNGGSVTADGPIVASFTLPNGLSVESGGSCSQSSNLVTCTSNASLVAPDGVSISGGSVEFVLPVVISADAIAGSIKSLTASVPAATTSAVGASGGETNLWNNSTTISLTVNTPRVDLVLAVTRPATTKAGSTADIQMTVTNRGTSDAPNFSLRYNIPQSVQNFGSLPSGCSRTSTLIICDVSTGLAVGSTRSFNVTVKVDTLSVAGLTVLGSMEVSTSGADDIQLANNKGTTEEANLNVVVDTPVVDTPVVDTPVGGSTLPDAGGRHAGAVFGSLAFLMLGAFFMLMSRGAKRRN